MSGEEYYQKGIGIGLAIAIEVAERCTTVEEILAELRAKLGRINANEN